MLRMKEITVRNVYEMIIRTYSNPHFPREMFIHKSYCDYEKLGAVFFAINGSPPKGYAIYIPGHHKLVVIDAWGKQRVRSEQYEITDLDNFKDFDILLEETNEGSA